MATGDAGPRPGSELTAAELMTLEYSQPQMLPSINSLAWIRQLQFAAPISGVRRLVT